MKFAALSNPLLIVGDNPSLAGGLSRICRDLATLAATIPEFRVGVLGRGEGNRRGFPFSLYSYCEKGEWGQDHLVPAWTDFSAGSDGLIMTTDDPSRRLWFADSRASVGELQTFLGPGRNFRKIGYFPIDSAGPNGISLGSEGIAAVAGYDRVLAASEWGRDVLRAGGRMDADYLPHGIFTETFRPVENAREMLGWSTDDIWVGSVMANQSRKDFPALFECAAVLKREWGNRFKLWLHTDLMIRGWNVPALAADYGLSDVLEVTLSATDHELALRYSGCSATLLPSAGEGWGYPIAESLACGTPCVVTDYGGGAELVQPDARVVPIGFRVDTPHNVRRAVLSGHGFARTLQPLALRKHDDWEFEAARHAQSVEHLDWQKLRFLWERWLRECLR